MERREEKERKKVKSEQIERGGSEQDANQEKENGREGGGTEDTRGRETEKKKENEIQPNEKKKKRTSLLTLICSVRIKNNIHLNCNMRIEN